MPATIDDVLIPLREAFLPIMGADRKYEKCLYYRHPTIWNPGTPQEKPNRRAGWIIWAGNNRDRMADMMERGFVPLRKFGIAARFQAWEKEAQGTPDQYGPWGAILCHPEGPAAFPVEQVMAYRWYDPRHCPVPGVAFPQLTGKEIVEYSCPDCTDRTFGLALHLARHLRTGHDWTVDDLVKFGDAMGLDFSREFGKQAKTVRVYRPDGSRAPMLPGQPSVVPPPTVERVVPVRSEPAKPEPTEKQLAARAAASERMRARNEAARAAKQAA
ncbi:MAG: hypothetical protein NUW01_20175 [Gemmatimonadaceae bacterium]|nr:hypothetical protein [Gemmatimonadaceae bacterium]